MPVAYIGTGRMFWQEQLHHLLVEAHRKAAGDVAFAAAVRPILTEHGLEALLSIPGEEISSYLLGQLWGHRRQLQPVAEPLINALRTLLKDEIPAQRSGDAFMSWTMAREMAREGVTFGAHTVTHRLMTTLTTDEVKDEIRMSRDVIKNEIDCDVDAFSYPNGDWNPFIAQEVQAAGFTVSFSTTPGPVAEGDHPLAIRRINVQEDMTSTDGMFMARILGLV